MAHQDEKPLNELLSRSMVEIYVGQSQAKWVLHEKLLCHYSPFFRKTVHSSGTSFGLPEEDEKAFRAVVGWLYSSLLPQPREERDLTVLLDTYLIAEKWGMTALAQDTLHAVREWYRTSETYPGLRRVQYVYANAEPRSPLRHLLVHSVARQLVLDKAMAGHWNKALRKNADLAVDLLQAVQDWRLDDDVVPDARSEPEPGALDEGEESGEADGDTVVESPSELRMPEHPLDAKKSTGLKSADTFKGADMLKGLQQLPNGLAGDDYGTRH